MRGRVASLWISTICVTLFYGQAFGEVWQMKQRDMCHTGRADFIVPAERMNGGFFDARAWQTPAPGSPNEGNFGSTAMSFYDGIGPGGADLIVGTYHWPKGVQGMDRHTGASFWFGNPCGGESIALIAPAFSNDGSTVYVTNDATGNDQFPNGFPLMALSATAGPAYFWHNGSNAQPDHLSIWSPTLDPNGRVFLHSWCDRPYAGADDGASITEVWGADSQCDAAYSDPTLCLAGGQLRVVIGGRDGHLRCFDGTSGSTLWNVAGNGPIDAPATIDPANGNIYVGSGVGDIYVMGLDQDGHGLWTAPALRIYEYVEGSNHMQRSQAAGCLSHDGETYYFQTNSQEGDGRLYAINTATGEVRWVFETRSTGWELASSSPIVTPNGVIIIGNNLGDVYFALLDEGSHATALDSLPVFSAGGEWGSRAIASATLSADGYLYLPVRTYWTKGNADDQTPSGRVENLFSALDLRRDAVVSLPPPPNQTAVALNHAVQLSWDPVLDPGEALFDHYAVYRDTIPFDDVSNMIPIGSVDQIDSGSYRDETAANGTSYYYAVTSVTRDGIEEKRQPSCGPRTPFDETDLQVTCISITPRFPRYDPQYESFQIVEPSGYGPYWCEAATGLGSGQDESTQRWPEVGDPVTYSATVRNRGTNTWSGLLPYSWSVDYSVVESQAPQAELAPGDTWSSSLNVTWDGDVHEILFALSPSDARSSNDSMTVSTHSVGFLTYIDRTRLEEFREQTRNVPSARTDDYIDWLNNCMSRFNELFADAESARRVHYDVLEVIHDSDPSPAVDRMLWACFPFRIFKGEMDPRDLPYYHPDDDVDYGFLHEWGHQLGLIDLYRINLEQWMNQVNGEMYRTVECLMNGCSPVLSEHSANAMTQWFGVAAGYFGQYLYRLPAHVKLRLLDDQGVPLHGATVKVYQKEDVPGIGEILTNQVRAQGVTDENGEWVMPNVEIDPELLPAALTGDSLRANPFGYVHNQGLNGLQLLEINLSDQVDYAWLDITELNNAYWGGQMDTAVVGKQFDLPSDVDSLPEVRTALGIRMNHDKDGIVIYYDLPRREAVDLRVFDISGREVAQLVSGLSDGGHYEVDWTGGNSRGADQGPGVYMVRLRVDGREFTKKAVLVR